jgi:hypothetical protein
VKSDFNGDGKADILWQNSSTGERLIWLMNGTTYTSTVNLGFVATSLSITGSSDFNGDGKSDILLQNSSTGERLIMAHERHRVSIQCQFGIRGDILEHHWFERL